MESLTLEKVKQMLEERHKISEGQFLEVCSRLARLRAKVKQLQKESEVDRFLFVFFEEQIEDMTNLLVERQANPK